MTIRNKVIVGASVVAAAYSIYKIKPLCESFPLKKRDKVYGNNRNSIRKSSSRRSTSSRRSGSLRSRRNHSSKSNRRSKSSSGRKSKSRSGKRSKSRSGRRSNRRSSKRSRTRSGKSSRKRSGKRSRKRSDKRSRTRSGRRSRSRKSKSRSRSRSRKKNSAKCSKCMIVQKKLQHYSELVADAKKSCTECTSLGLVKNQLLACINRDILGAVFQPGKSFTSYKIQDGDTGFSYPKLFTRFLNDSYLTRIEIDDPYIIQQYQFSNLLRIVELIIKTENNVTFIKLKTKPDCLRNEIAHYMSNLSLDLQNNFGVHFEIDINGDLHDREIRLNNGFSVKLGRGLDYFKQSQPYEIGYYDMDMRPCRATTIDVMHESGLMKN